MGKQKGGLALFPRPGPRRGSAAGRWQPAPAGTATRGQGFAGRAAGSSGEEEGEEVPGGRPGNCNSLWMGWTGWGGERSQASPSINLPSGPTGWSRGCSLSPRVRRDPAQLCRGGAAWPGELRSLQAIAARPAARQARPRLAVCTLGCLQGSAPQRPGSHTA